MFNYRQVAGFNTMQEQEWGNHHQRSQSQAAAGAAKACGFNWEVYHSRMPGLNDCRSQERMPVVKNLPEEDKYLKEIEDALLQIRNLRRLSHNPVPEQVLGQVEKLISD